MSFMGFLASFVGFIYGIPAQEPTGVRSPDGAQRNPGILPANGPAPDFAEPVIGRRFAPTRWLHPGYKPSALVAPSRRQVRPISKNDFLASRRSNHL
jgi:hypothetical protein